MIKLLILSDDFTGALDTSVHFAKNGVKTKVVFERNYLFSQDDDTEVAVIDAETRHISPGEAYSVIYSIVRRGMDAGISYFYLKTDSALRGNIGSCLEALLRASEAKMLPFIPAYPKMKRFTKKGIHYIDTVKVGESVFGKDPFNPVTSSSVREIISQQTDIPCLEVYSRDKTVTAEIKTPSVVIYDSETDMDIRYWAEKLSTEGNLKIMAGCAGFASILPGIFRIKKSGSRKISLKNGIFAVSGSINPITLEQIGYAAENGCRYYPVLDIVRKMLKEKDYIFAGSREFSELADLCRHNPYLIIDSSGNTGENPAEGLARETGLSLDQLRERILQILGSISKELLNVNRDSILMITGGDTLIGLLRALDVHDMEPIEEIMPGIVLSSFIYRGEPYEIITKSGGFGEKDIFLGLINCLKERENESGWSIV